MKPAAHICVKHVQLDRLAQVPGGQFTRCDFLLPDGLPVSHIAWQDHRIDLPTGLGDALPRRQGEYLAGRLCAALALRALGSAKSDLPRNADRSPHWPAGIVGAITHMAGHAAALVAPSSDYAGIGIDLEPIMPAAKAKRVQAKILTDTEMTLCPNSVEPHQFITMVYSAKEAIFKAVYPQTQRYFGLMDASLILVSDKTLTFQLNEPIAETKLTVEVNITPEHCLSILARPVA